VYIWDFSEGIKDLFLNKRLVINRGVRDMDDYQDVLVAEVKRLRGMVVALQAEVTTLVSENKSLYSLLSNKRAEEKEQSTESPLKTMVRDKVDSMLLNREIDLLLREKPEILA
jgi:regulator of replication initiation timing